MTPTRRSVPTRSCCERAKGTYNGSTRVGTIRPSQAIHSSGLCSFDPLCADHEPDSANSSLHGAACHACLLVAETSCERGNRYLDRSTLVDTFRHTGREYGQNGNHPDEQASGHGRE